MMFYGSRSDELLYIAVLDSSRYTISSHLRSPHAFCYWEFLPGQFLPLPAFHLIPQPLSLISLVFFTPLFHLQISVNVLLRAY